MIKHVVAVAVALLGLQVGDANAVGTLIPAPNRVDMVHDAKRGVIYVSSSNGQVLRYHLPSGSFLTPIVVGGQPGGIDLSLDGDVLAVADRTRTATDVWVHRIELATTDLKTTKLTAPKAHGEGGTWTVAFDAEGKLLSTSTFEGGGWAPMRRFDVVTGASSILHATVMQNTMLSASGDGQTIAFAEPSRSDGPWGLYDVPTGQVVRREGYQDGTSSSNYEIATDALGSQFAIRTANATFIYDDVYAKIATIGTHGGRNPSAQPIIRSRA